MVGEDTCLYVIRVLKALNYYYSLRGLEKVLGIPFQNLWRYVNMMTIPRRETAEKILGRVRELGLLEKTAFEVLRRSGRKLRELSGDPGFLRLFSLIIEDLPEMSGVDIVMPLSEYAVPLASLIAVELGLKICPAILNYVGYGKEGITVGYRTSRRSSKLGFTAIPRKCVAKGVKVSLIDIVIEDLDNINTIVNMVRDAEAEPYCAVCIRSTRELYSKLRELGIEKIRIFDLM